MKEKDEAQCSEPVGSRMFGLQDKSGRMFQWDTPEHDRKAPLLFESKRKHDASRRRSFIQQHGRSRWSRR